MLKKSYVIMEDDSPVAIMETADAELVERKVKTLQRKSDALVAKFNADGRPVPNVRRSVFCAVLVKVVAEKR